MFQAKRLYGALCGIALLLSADVSAQGKRAPLAEPLRFGQWIILSSYVDGCRDANTLGDLLQTRRDEGPDAEIAKLTPLLDKQCVSILGTFLVLEPHRLVRNVPMQGGIADEYVVRMWPYLVKIRTRDGVIHTLFAPPGVYFFLPAPGGVVAPAQTGPTNIGSD